MKLKILTALIAIVLLGATMPVEARPSLAPSPPSPEPPDPILAAEHAFGLALEKHLQRLESGNLAQMQKIQVAGDWAYAVIQHLDTFGNVIPYDFAVLLSRRSPDGGWVVVADPLYTPAQDYNAFLAQVPDDLLDESDRAFLHLQESSAEATGNFSSHKLPWPAGEKGKVAQKDGYKHASQIDFLLAAVGSSGVVYASKPGTVVFVKESSSHDGQCLFDDWQKANIVVVQHSTAEYSWYVHLAHDSVPVSKGDSVGYGTKIGIEGDTGYSCATHLHYMASSGHTNWTSPSDPDRAPWATGITAVDFVEKAWSDLKEGNQYESENRHTSVCDANISGQVRVYGSGELVTGAQANVIVQGIKITKTTDSDGRYRFFDIPAGSTVKIRAAKDGVGSGSITPSVPCHVSVVVPDIYLLPMCMPAMASAATSNDNCNVNYAPSSPSLRSPSDGYVAHDSRSPTLCWSKSSDPDGDSVQYYAEVYDSPVNANSGWTSNTCWRPSSLDNQYHDYQWRVKARDTSYFAESDWSSTWHFTIESPNALPSVSFDTANGSSANRIDSRERDWTFLGTANDPEGQLNRVEFRCTGDNCGTAMAHSSGSTWSHTQNDLAGQNDIYFVAYDGIGQSRSSRHLDLRIDLAPPSTSASLNGDTDPAHWPAWFTAPVQVRLQAEDGSTGRARVGVQEVRYRVDGGAWQANAGGDASFAINADGAHAVEYYAVDKVGNQESMRTVSFQLDQTPPGPPAGVAETQGTASDVWQRTTNTPTFTWDASTDNTSGVWGYQLYFGADPNGEAYQTFMAADPRTWTPQPAGVRTGTYYLRGRTRDNASNWSPWTSLFTFRYDGAPPENPSGVTHAAGVANDTWQRTTAAADFSWPIPHDEGSGIKGYGVYWGSDPAGTNTDFITANQYASGPLCGSDRACTGYLRLRSQDNVDNPAQDWTTAFVLRYDGAPPTADFTFNGGVTQTQQTLVTLNLAATDEGSGVKLMQFSGDGESWTPWEVYAPQRQWQIPAISRQWWPVYLRVQDGVGLESSVISHAIYLEVNPDQPRSATYRLFDHALSAGGDEYNSPGYRGRGTLGQTLDASRVSSAHYALVGGYEAGSQALPIVRPAHDEFNFVNGIFASGVVAPTLRSATFQMVGTVGELGLPNNQTTLSSGSYRHQPGFLAAQPPPAAVTPTPTPGPTPTPTPTPACAEPLIRINGGAAFTSHPSVELNICSPTAVEMRVSNSEDFADAQWEPYTNIKTWTLPVAGQQVLPRFVYVAFRAADGVVSSTYFDDIIYDPNAPAGVISAGDSVAGAVQAMAAGRTGLSTTASRVGEVTYLARSDAAPLAVLAPKADGAVDLFINAMDDNSGMAEMQISADAGFTDAAWEPFSALKPYTPADGDGVKTVYARFRDEASNVSASAETSFMLDTEAPYGGIALDRRVVGPDVITTTVYLGAEDNLSGVTDVRLSLDPGFGDAAWQPYTSTVTWPISLTEGSAGTLYAQYRDLAGNISAVYTDTYTVDLTPPQVYVEVEPAETLTRTVHIYAYDELAALDTMMLSNDPLMVDDVVTQPYTDTVTWSFDERRVVWVQLKDTVGNLTEPYPAYAEEVLAPMAVTVTISQDSVSTTLTWQHLASNRQYEVWRSTFPYLNPDEPDANLERLAVLDPPMEGSAMMIQDAAGPYYYLVRSLNALGVYADSIRVGRFEFQLVPGGN